MRTREQIEKSHGNKGRKLSPRDRARVTKQLRLMAISRRGTKRPSYIGKKISASKKGINTVGEGDKHPQWMGDDIEYPGIHQWLRKHFGKANQCQNRSCEQVSINYDWAKVRGVTYQRRREFFLMLCRSCHRRYDKNPLYPLDIRDLLNKEE